MTRTLSCTVLITLAVMAITASGHVHGAATVPFSVPSDSTIPGGPKGEAIKLGKALINETRKMLPKNVGNGLDCTSCHLGAGTTPSAAPYVGLWGVFPDYRARGGDIDSLQERINDCFERSMNGKALAFDSKEMNAILMYIHWLSTGVPTGTEVVGRGMGDVDTSLKPDPVRGKQIYTAKCAACHGVNGEGIKGGVGDYGVPPVWGNASFNIGAGLARTYTAAGFIKHNMPLGQGGSLSDQDAVDVAEYMTHQPRPPFAAAKNDYLKGKKPKDARN